jgi:nitrate/TMAO reductase-like tetraheme cytochrome c subunit
MWKSILAATGIFAGFFFLIVGGMWGGRVLEHKPSFCISCHEMKPSYDNWIASGASKHHPDCIQCHSGVLSACPQHLFSLFLFLNFQFFLLFFFFNLIFD